ncbi:hypothetical protein MC885_002622, partial [Smutsia gigantea]
YLFVPPRAESWWLGLAVDSMSSSDPAVKGERPHTRAQPPTTRPTKSPKCTTQERKDKVEDEGEQEEEEKKKEKSCIMEGKREKNKSREVGNASLFFTKSHLPLHKKRGSNFVQLTGYISF